MTPLVKHDPQKVRSRLLQPVCCPRRLFSLNTFRLDDPINASGLPEHVQRRCQRFYRNMQKLGVIG